MRAHRHRIRVIYGDTDQMGVVYYANYLRFFEAGRNELLRAAGVPYRELESEGYALPVTKVSVEYLAPARYDDELELETTVTMLRHVSVKIEYRLVRVSDGELIATGETTHACLGPERRLTRFPAIIKDKLGADSTGAGGTDG